MDSVIKLNDRPKMLQRTIFAKVLQSAQNMDTSLSEQCADYRRTPALLRFLSTEIHDHSTRQCSRKLLVYSGPAQLKLLARTQPAPSRIELYKTGFQASTRSQNKKQKAVRTKRSVRCSARSSYFLQHGSTKRNISKTDNCHMCCP